MIWEETNLADVFADSLESVILQGMIIFIVTLDSMSYVRACDACMCVFAFLL